MLNKTLDLKYKNTLFIKRFQPFYLNDMRFLMIAYSVIMTYHSKLLKTELFFHYSKSSYLQIYERSNSKRSKTS